MKSSKEARSALEAIVKGTALLAIVFLLATFFFYYVRDTGAALRHHLNPEISQALKLIHKQNGSIFTAEGPEGVIIGAIPDVDKRHKFLTITPFLECAGAVRCSGWIAVDGGRFDHRFPLLRSHELSGHFEALYRIATSKPSHCAYRNEYLSTSPDIGPARIEVFCFHSESGTFMYELLSP